MAGAPPPDDSSLVVVLLDTSLHFWNAVVRSSSGLQQVLSFLNSLALMNHMNHLVIIASGCNSCEFLYDSLDSDERAGANHQTASEKIVHKLNDFVSRDATQPPKFQPSLLSASLSMALCYIQRALKEKIGPSKPRMLCLQASPDAPHQYIAIMNAIFSAQRSMVPIDACMVGAQHSAFLQQAADITGGTYLMPQQADSLLEYLMAIHPAPPLGRSGFSGLTFFAAVSATNAQLTWAIYARFVYQSSASNIRSAQLAAQALLAAARSARRPPRDSYTEYNTGGGRPPAAVLVVLVPTPRINSLRGCSSRSMLGSCRAAARPP
ncbi:general transcription and DNA repair factor IIH subunit TFB4 isoform X1 [Selaginella moellendorffii]|uniref:general transcription and DNA repair factor IIH subunit TFB4 isoform X1 n=1 Tax=Selaginella moellendorffii TaxID=88036 RepID=UPI000D1C99D5|nr:general transcription and DNA repair factor IIH subunit TFB4 isoform X1 [Selaginella moellendorffii]|eukprot:XP_024522762.1 general transcription and DNA repair factor IIH subunit TFB4 isoform X1 [Selaginella moellendorffii]